MLDFDGLRILIAVAAGALGGWVMCFRFVVRRCDEVIVGTTDEFRIWYNEALTELYRSRDWKRRWKKAARHHRRCYDALRNSLAVPDDRPGPHGSRH